MRKLLLIYLLSFSSLIFSQKNIWQEFPDEDVVTLQINKSEKHQIRNFNFDFVWDDNLSYSKNIGHYGGIKKLSIYKNKKKLQIINCIKDNIALGYIYFRFYDFNFDGHIDFTLPINSKWEMYFIFNPETEQFEHREDWDYIRIQKIDRKNKQILSEPDGMVDNRIIYQIKGIKISELR